MLDHTLQKIYRREVAEVHLTPEPEDTFTIIITVKRRNPKGLDNTYLFI